MPLLRVFGTCVLLLSAACSTGQQSGAAAPDPAATASPTPPPLVQAWQRPDLRAVTRPVLSEGSLLLYTLEEGFLQLTSLDPRNGATRWQREATDSGITAGVAFGVTVSDGKAFFLRQDEQGGYAQLVAVQIRDGEELWATDRSAGWLDMPSLCKDDAGELCAGAYLDGQRALLRVSVADGQLRPATPRQEPAGRGLADELRDVGERSPDILARITDAGEPVWRRSATDVFGGHDVTSDSGWSFLESDGLYVGMLGRRQPERDSTDPFVLGASVLAGFEKANGATRWVRPDVAFGCNGSLSDHGEAGEEGPLFYLCRFTGTVTRKGDERVVSDDMTAVVEGFDPQTGAATWSVDLGRVPGLAIGEPPALRLPDGRVVVRAADSTATALDLRTGLAETVPGSTRGWCPRENRYETGDGVAFNNKRNGQELLVPCRADGAPVDLPDSLEGPFGVRHDDLLVWADLDGLSAARAG